MDAEMNEQRESTADLDERARAELRRTALDTPGVHVTASGPPASAADPAPRSPAADGPTRPRHRRRVPTLRHVIADVRTTWYLLVFLPVLALWTGVEAVRDLLHRLNRDSDIAGERAPFVRPGRMPRRREDRSVADISANLREFPWTPTPLPARAAFYRTFGADAFGMLLAGQPAVSALPHLYPRAFKPRLFAGFDGQQIAGLQAMHDTAAPALIICPGLLTNKNFDYVRRIAKRAYNEWGFHVVCVDLRAHGQTQWTSQAPSSAGWGEGADIVEVARALKADPRVTTVGALGYSLGGCTVLNAANHASLADDDALDGGVLSVSGPTDLHSATEYISTKPAAKDPFFGLWYTFQMGLRQAEREYDIKLQSRDFREFTRRVAIPFYGVSEQEFLDRGSAALFAGKITVPTLALHASDDYVVPVHHAHLLQQAAADNPNIDVWVLDRGSHCSFDSVDSRWYYSVVRRWFEYWADEAV
jgi:predicted alpha/beta-fold hydrolase